MNPEQERLRKNEQKEVPLEKWGPYLSERQWATVREDYSANGDAWAYFPHDHARSRVYRWGEDGLGGISDSRQNLCFALALWNGKDSILKERLFGLTNSEGNHGEDVKELYYYLDNTPTHAYMKFLYQYPQSAFPYEQLIEENRNRNRLQPEYELLDTGVFDNNRYFDVFVEYAKNNSEDICIQIEAWNRGDESATIWVLPTLWFRNRWAYGELNQKPLIQAYQDGCVRASHEFLEDYFLYFQSAKNTLFTENETNIERVFGDTNRSPFVKDAFHEAICKKNEELYSLLKNTHQGTKFAPIYELNIEPKSSQKILLRLSNTENADPFNHSFSQIFSDRLQEAEEFYQRYVPQKSKESEQDKSSDSKPTDLRSVDLKNIQRQAFAGLLWSKQYYHYDVERWLEGDPNQIAPPDERFLGRNAEWTHLKNQDVISMPDTWEYPWYAAWDLAFHCVPMAMLDPTFAKNQLILITREWYMSPNGQIPAYEWNFSDVNPPVHAWAALSIFRIEKTLHGREDINFLKRIFQKLLINFTWWANREDENGNNIFTGGFLGLDNIAVINRDKLPLNSHLEQVDATAWMAMYALNMMDIALEIAQHDTSFEDTATKFYEHFVLIAESLNKGLWDADEHFFYDLLYSQGGRITPMKVRSIVGLSALFAVSIIDQKKIANLTDFKKRIAYIKDYRTKANKFLPSEQMAEDGNILLSLVNKTMLARLLQVMLDEKEFLSVGGIRALSKYYEKNPYSVIIRNQEYTINYVSGDSDSEMFGGNSNWRGPVWMPINYLIIKSLKKYYQFYGDSFKIEFPTGSGLTKNLNEVSGEISNRILGIFQRNEEGERLVHGVYQEFYNRPHNKDLVLFYEYFDGDTAHGVGASHQTGWTATVAELINEAVWEKETEEHEIPR
ncbi:MGH1-like glycoside hydrolase domain-containing protein [Emticicia sp. BO119]|uniref:MGH1-like glycoside hydrolase domain-containing protein n=1 Tax=Emticicia sp. BO119 TaxID=2757768 RepID=UPI0015EFEB15|nr:glucosidase [Emticicia sp. BO119]MBA4852751.1 glucosidase [Emticicia sp. BO119]